MKIDQYYFLDSKALGDLKPLITNLSKYCKDRSLLLWIVSWSSKEEEKYLEIAVKGCKSMATLYFALQVLASNNHFIIDKCTVYADLSIEQFLGVKMLLRKKDGFPSSY